MMRRPLGVAIAVCLILAALLGCAEDRAATKKKAEAKQSLGLTLIQGGQIDAGLNELKEAARLDPENAEIQNATALAYRDMGNTKEAIRHFHDALALKPNFPDAENNLGTVYLMLHEWDKAIQHFEKAAHNVSYRTPYMAYTNIGYAYHHMGQFQKAIEYYQKAIEHWARYSPAYDNMGLAYEMLGESERAVEASPSSPLPHLHLARLYLNLSMIREASESLNEVIRLDPQGLYGQEAKKLLDEIRGRR
jgi:type IV pilus biogenesis/stability protein PilW